VTDNGLITCLWFDTEGEEAAKYYTSIFPNSKIVEVARYGSAGPRTEGTVMTVTFELDGQQFVALNGGPNFTFNEAISLQIMCTDQDEVDYYWDRLSAGGQAVACGWLKDRYGLSWQVIPVVLIDMMSDADPEKVRRVTEAMLRMTKLDVAALEKAAVGE